MVKSDLDDWGRSEYKRADLGEAARGKYAKLSKADQEKVASEYHRVKPTDFDEVMSRAKRESPNVVSKSKRKSGD